MKVEFTRIPDVKLISPTRHSDERGFFAETWNARALARFGINPGFVQDNMSYSKAAGTIRGLHIQKPPHAQAKLVQVVRGEIMDVAVDVRRNSPTYGNWVSAILSAENGRQLWVPEGFLHGFVTRRADTIVSYKVTGYYSASADLSVRHDDPLLGIDWGVPPHEAILSEKDRDALPLMAFESPFRMELSA